MWEAGELEEKVIGGEAGGMLRGEGVVVEPWGVRTKEAHGVTGR